MHKNFLYFTIIIAMLFITGCTKETVKPKPDTKVLQDFKEATVKTIAGTGVEGMKDGDAKDAKFALPYNLVVDKDGVIYISDMKNHLIRAVTPEGEVKTIAGSTDGTKSIFNEPKGITIDKEGIIYVADSKNGAIRSISPSGNVETVIKGLEHPSDVVVDKNGDLFISETLKHRIIKITKKEDGWFSLEVLAGGGYEKQEDGIYIGDYKDGTGEEAKFNEPSGLALGEDGNLYVADTANQRIRMVTADGEVTTIAGSEDAKISGTSYIQGAFKDGKATEAKFNFPNGIAIGENNEIYVADTYNHRIRVITPDKKVFTVAGLDEHGIKDGKVTDALLDGPTGIYFSKDGSLLITDHWNNLIREISVK